MTTTFMRVPRTPSGGGAGVAVIGAPFDFGPSYHRFGAHLGPAAIRAASLRVLPARIDSDRDPLRELDVYDVGDLDLPLDDPDEALQRVRAGVGAVLEAGSTPLVFGGDGSIALAVLRAVAEHANREVAVLHFDAHTDCNPPDTGANAAACAFWLAHEEGLTATSASFHIGLRGPTLTANSARLCRGLGYRTVSMDDITDGGVAALLDELHHVVGDAPVYVCWDMDVFDPSAAPGVFSPSWGGLTAAQGMRLVHGLGGLEIVGADINTVSPPHDSDELTAWLAAQLAFELLYSLPTP
jgi:agmatinase